MSVNLFGIIKQIKLSKSHIMSTKNLFTAYWHVSANPLLNPNTIYYPLRILFMHFPMFHVSVFHFSCYFRLFFFSSNLFLFLVFLCTFSCCRCDCYLFIMRLHKTEANHHHAYSNKLLDNRTLMTLAKYLLYFISLIFLIFFASPFHYYYSPLYHSVFSVCSEHGAQIHIY